MAPGVPSHTPGVVPQIGFVPSKKIATPEPPPKELGSFRQIPDLLDPAVENLNSRPARHTWRTSARVGMSHTAPVADRLLPHAI